MQKKIELLGIGFSPDPLVIDDNIIEPKEAITFLGFTISSDLKMDEHVNNVCKKLRSAAGRIRSEGRLFTIALGIVVSFSTPGVEALFPVTP